MWLLYENDDVNDVKLPLPPPPPLLPPNLRMNTPVLSLLLAVARSVSDGPDMLMPASFALLPVMPLLCFAVKCRLYSTILATV
jgi:hypothetical protein